MGIAYHDNCLYVCDTSAGCVHVWDLATGSARRLGVAGGSSKPVAVAVGHEGKVYVADAGRGEVAVYDPAGRLIQRLKPADQPNYRPVGVAAADYELYVTDMEGHRIDVYSTKTGQWIRSSGRAGDKHGELYYPRGIDVGPEGCVYVADMMNSRIEVLGASGDYLRSIGAPGDRSGKLGRPRDVDVAPDGTVFVADAEFGCIHLFDAAGRLLLVVGGLYDGPGGTPLPNGIAVATLIPAQLSQLVPAGFRPSYYLWVCSTAQRKRLGLFAVGAFETLRP